MFHQRSYEYDATRPPTVVTAHPGTLLRYHFIVVHPMGVVRFLEQRARSPTLLRLRWGAQHGTDGLVKDCFEPLLR